MAQEVEHICIICGWKYDDRYGKWEDLPDDFECPDCRAEKDLFEEINHWIDYVICASDGSRPRDAV